MRKKSGETVPCTTISPSPYDEETCTTFRFPDSGSMVNITPEVAMSDRTIFMTTTETAPSRGSMSRAS